MTQAIVTYLNAVIDTVGRVDERYCMAELRSDGTTTVPYTYVGNGKVKPISIDGGSLSYWRISGAVPPMEQIASQYGKPRLSATYPLRLVIIARRADSTVDDGFMPTRLAEDIANALTGSHPDLKTLLKANTVSVSAGYDVNITSVWADEFKGTGVNDPNYTRTIMALSVSVNVVGDRSCWENECDYDPDILHLFDFCQAGTVARLTDEQVTCLEAALCDPCADATIAVNTTPFGTAPSGGALNVPVVNGGDNPVGIKQGSEWVIGNNSTFINATQVTDQQAEVDANIFVTLDGAQSGTWNAGLQTWEVTSSGASVEVTVSSLTPVAGSTLTITATPTGITPTSYTFFAYDGTTVTLIVQQAGNVYNWNVSKFGNYDIYVLATDGTINAYGKVSVVVTSTFLLDQIASSPELAFSLRRLKASYVGNAATVRRSTDNATQAIGFVGENFDTASFISFVGVGNAFSAILYNQSMRFNATQPTAANQPTMAIGGTISMLNGKPTIVFDTQGDVMNFTPIGSSHVFAVARAITINASQAQYICGYAASGMGIAGTGVSGIFMFNSPTLIATTIKDTVAHQLSFRCGLSNTARIRVDGTTRATGTMLSMVVSAIGGNPGAGFASNIEMSEFISFSSNIPDAEELVIESNQKAYYGTP